ncbi:MAG: VOC family protein [Armatimonadetes bacterium]|nr:MAG: VOC family protein [Armatimonadota bacterium]
MIPQALITFLPSHDLGRSADFYTDVLNLSLVLDQGTCLIYRVTESSFIGVCKRDEFGDAEPVITTIVADDVDGWYRQITGAGWSDVSEPEHSDTYKLYHIWITDPDGNKLEIQRFDDQDWAGGTQT